MPVPSLLAVFAHPDDESLMAGGTLARHAAAGARTAVVTATWAADTPRAAELAEALHVLGAGKPRLLGYADSRVPRSAPGRPRLCDAPLDETVGGLVARIRDFRPEIVVTHDAYGGLTGHEDHVHTHRVTLSAVHAAGLERLYPDAGEPWQPSALYLSTHPHSAVRAWGGHLAPTGKAMRTVPDDRVTTTVDVTPWLDRKITAVLAHRTEVERGAAPGLIAALPAPERERLLGTEWYIRHELVATARAGTELLP
ncbi:PIG-L deacetylase family protein [Streptomyces azureus]|uniref:1D-myo-inosityl-2-acetamido-2-deoxy-alpha-D-glucopyranoside deacetylase n=1 Tax=Streptomyces azureus TaxID=146537 RepID=A0A0K8PR23_STRAJ|nr:PIG-L deacetylase family protein [Streptomyces azureus]GAP50306.1 1D-myo-inosityl-2-acetamido-2-deoxy-alpha-D-glucopyranoside deacetylase [Streptomyces azureus]